VDISSFPHQVTRLVFDTGQPYEEFRAREVPSFALAAVKRGPVSTAQMCCPLARIPDRNQVSQNRAVRDEGYCEGLGRSP
jgi:hypothetical protein